MLYAACDLGQYVIVSSVNNTSYCHASCSAGSHHHERQMSGARGYTDTETVIVETEVRVIMGAAGASD